MKTDKEKFELIDQLTSNEVSKWHQESNYRIENEKDIRKSQLIAFEILSALRAKGLSQKDLSLKLNVSQQLVSKWLKGDVNFTCDTVESIEKALKIKLIDIHSNKVEQKGKSAIFTKVHTLLFKPQKDNTNDNINDKWNTFEKSSKCAPCCC